MLGTKYSAIILRLKSNIIKVASKINNYQMADGRPHRRLESFRGVNSGKVSVIQAEPIGRFELPDEVQDLRLVLQTVNDQRLEKYSSGRIGLVQFSSTFGQRIFVAKSNSILVVHPDSERVFESPDRDAGDGQDEAEEGDDPRDDGDEMIFEQKFATEKVVVAREAVAVDGSDEV
jgi:hypothetical protein